MFHFCFMDHVGHFEYYESLRKIAWAVGIVMASFIEISTNQYDGIGIFFTFRVMLPGLWSRVTAEPPLQYWGKAPFSGSKNGKTWYVQHASPLGVRFPACFFPFTNPLSGCLLGLYSHLLVNWPEEMTAIPSKNQVEPIRTKFLTFSSHTITWCGEQVQLVAAPFHRLLWHQTGKISKVGWCNDFRLQHSVHVKP